MKLSWKAGWNKPQVFWTRWNSSRDMRKEQWARMGAMTGTGKVAGAKRVKMNITIATPAPSKPSKKQKNDDKRMTWISKE